MTDQATPEPLADDQLAEIRMHDRAYATDPSDAPILVEAATDRRLLLATVDRLRARNADLHRRLGEHMDDLGDARAENAALATRLEEARQAAGAEAGRAAALEAAYQEARTGRDARDAEIERLHTETRRLGVSLAETIQERQQLRTRLADAEQTRRAALAVAEDLTGERDQARAALQVAGEIEADLTTKLDELARLQDRIPDDANGDWGLGWDNGYNAALSEVRAMAARATSQGRVSGPETTGGHPSESTAVPGRPGPVQGSEVPDVDGWTIYPTTDGGLMVSHGTDADQPTLASDDSIPLAAVLAFIADADEETPEPGERTE